MIELILMQVSGWDGGVRKEVENHPRYVTALEVAPCDVSEVNGYNSRLIILIGVFHRQ